MSTMTTVHTNRRHSLENRIPPPLVVILIGASMAALAGFAPAVEFGGKGRIAIGAVLVAVGGLVVVQGARTFWRNETTIDPVDLKRASTLVTTGVFRYSRNPMYLGFAVALLGWAVCLASPWAVVGPVAFVLFTHRFQIIPEERQMQAKFGRAYDDYRERVRRWL